MGRLVSLAFLTAALVIAVTACGPKVNPATTPFDEDLDPSPTEVATDSAPTERAVAPAGPGVRTGTITRADLDRVLDAGPGAFLRQFEVAPAMREDRFLGWQLVQLVDHGSALAHLDLAPGDVLLSVNGTTISRPDQLQAVWDSLRTASHVTAELWRGDAKLTLAFSVSPTTVSSTAP